MIRYSLLLLFVASAASATTYYVRTDGNNACNGTTDAAGASGDCAKATPAGAASSAQAGDTVRIHNGSYAGWSSVRAGSSGSPITFQRISAETVTITSQIVIEHNYITLDGISMTHSDWYEGGAGIRIGQSAKRANITVRNVDLNCASNNSFLMLVNADDFLLEDSTLRGGACHIAIVHQGSRHTIQNSVFRDFSNIERVFNVASSDSVWRNNNIYGLTWDGDGTVHPDIWQTVSDGSIAQNNVIENNYVHDCPNVQLGNTETNTAGTNVSNWIWRNNVFANMGTLYIWTGNFKFYNNTFYRSSSTSQAAVYVYAGALGNGSGADFSNNIFVQETNQGIVATGSGSPTWTHTYNFVANTNFSARAGWTEATGVNGGNPQLTTVATDCITTTCNFHIGATSAAKDIGQTLSDVTVDRDGVSRPQGSAYDAGAYEYAADGTPPTITTTTLPNGTVGVAYSQPISVTPESPTPTCSVTSGTAPSGLTVNSNCTVTGTPTTEQSNVSFTVTATNGTAPDDTQDFVVTINAAPTGTAVGISGAVTISGNARI